MSRLPKVTLAATLGLLAALSGEARAEWRVQHGLDIAATTDSVLLIGKLDERATLYAKCLPKADVPAQLSIHVFDGLSDPVAGPAFAEVAISTDTGGLAASPGAVRRVPGYIVTEWVDAVTIRGLIDDLIGARAEISVTIHSPSSQESWTTSATGSTAAGRAFLEACAARLLEMPVVRDVPDDTAPAPAIPPPARAPVLPGAGG